jgi:hypothetical protein
MDTSRESIPPTPIARGGRSKVFILAVMAAALGLALVSINFLGPTERPEMLDQLFDPAPPPARVIVCEGTMATTCARAAARRTGMTVAWISEPTGYELAWLAASRNEEGPNGPAVASQYLVDADGRGWTEIVTAVPAIEVEPGDTPAILLSHDGDTASVWIDETLGLVSIEWTHDDIGYVLTAQPRPWDPTSVMNVWKQMRYAGPREV